MIKGGDFFWVVWGWGLNISLFTTLRRPWYSLRYFLGGWGRAGGTMVYKSLRSGVRSSCKGPYQF